MLPAAAPLCCPSTYLVCACVCVVDSGVCGALCAYALRMRACADVVVSGSSPSVPRRSHRLLYDKKTETRATDTKTTRKTRKMTSAARRTTRNMMTRRLPPPTRRMALQVRRPFSYRGTRFRTTS